MMFYPDCTGRDGFSEDPKGINASSRLAEIGIIRKQRKALEANKK
jgi:hypothetical protein